MALGEGNGDGNDAMDESVRAEQDRELRAATGLVIAFATLGILLEASLIILRFCNVGLVNLKIKIFIVIVS